MTAVMGWMRSNFGVYFDNATSRRDYRAQLRGNRAIILWTVYLLVLIGLGMLVYSTSVAQGVVSIVDAQRSLQDFYQAVMIILGSMIILVSPALAATAIAIERERRSLDLVFSAPVKPKSLLVGKMLSAYRYIWMLLVLSLPVTAMCVVLGGATWGEVLGAYALLSLHALVYSAMALGISSVCQKPAAALVWSYIAVGMYSLLAGGIATTAIAPRFMPMSGTSNEAPFTVAMSPIAVVQAAGTHSVLFGFNVPNWIVFGIYALLVSRLLLLGAASALSPYNSPETKNLRISGLIYFALMVYFITALSCGGSASAFGSPSATNEAYISGVIPAFMIAFLPLFPFLTCAGTDGERKFWPNGWFSFKEAIRGTPAGALPYLVSLVLLAGAAVSYAYWSELHAVIGVITFATVVWALGLSVFCWSLGRYASSIASELRAARTLHLASLIVILGLPVPFLAIIDPEQQSGLWWLYPPYALWGAPDSQAQARLGIGLAMLCVGAVIGAFAEQRLRRKQAVASVAT